MNNFFSWYKMKYQYRFGFKPPRFSCIISSFEILYCWEGLLPILCQILDMEICVGLNDTSSQITSLLTCPWIEPIIGPFILSSYCKCTCSIYYLWIRTLFGTWMFVIWTIGRGFVVSLMPWFRTMKYSRSFRLIWRSFFC